MSPRWGVYGKGIIKEAIDVVSRENKRKTNQTVCC